ncbi:MAG: CarD family transcriptional regulator [Candidatus Muiribacteriaceae bacterium]
MFNIGETVLHPLHGAGVIEGIESKKILNRLAKFYIMSLPDSSLEKLFIPVDNAENLGVRYLIDEETIPEIETFLKEKYTLHINDKWKMQFKKQETKVNSGNIMQVAEAYKFLFHKSLMKKLGALDKWLLKKARDIIASEMTFVKNMRFDEAQNMIKGWVENSISE